MCGIAGVAFADPDRPVPEGLLDRMTRAVHHRGPDSRGQHAEAGVGLGVERLAIIDREGGDQPIASEDGAVLLVCNGEIYNSPELRPALEANGHRSRSRSDVEVIVHLYEEHGARCVERLRGMFAFALWDRRRRRLLLARDRLGIKPLVYAQTPDGLYFASEAKALLAAGAVEPAPDLLALDDVFTLGFVVGPRTMFRGIQRVSPGECLVYEAGRLRHERYWRLLLPPSEGEEPRDPRTWAERVRGKLEESVRLHLRSDVPVGVWLSTGVDSSGVAALALRATEGPLPAFTLAFEDPGTDETRRWATLGRFPGYDLPEELALCDRASFARYPQALWHAEEPSTTGTEIPRMVLAEHAARRVKVVLTGEGADELFGGYPWFHGDAMIRRVAGLPLVLRRLLAGALHRWRPRTARLLLAAETLTTERYQALAGVTHPEARGRLYSADLCERLRAAGGGVGAPAERVSLPTDPLAAAHPFTQLQHRELEQRLPDLIVHTLDRASMAYGLEARVPYLDHELVELCAAAPPTLHGDGRRNKPLLRAALRDVLPGAVLGRPKVGARPPCAAWLRGPLPSFAEELLSPQALRRKGYFDPVAVGVLLARHRRGGRAHPDHLMGVLAVQLWNELFRGQALASPHFTAPSAPGSGA